MPPDQLESPTGDVDRFEKRTIMGDSHFRTSLPKDYIDAIKPEHEHLRVIQSGDYLLFKKPTELDEKLHVTNSDNYLTVKIPVEASHVKKFELPEGIDDLVELGKPEHDKVPLVQRFMAKVLQSLVISGVTQIDITNLDSWEGRVRYDIDDALDTQEDSNIDVNTTKGKISIDEKSDPDTYIRDVREFLDLHLMRPLSMSITGDNDHMFEDVSDRIVQNDKDEQLDRSWAFSTREVANDFFNLQFTEYPESFCRIYVDKYLETTVDLTKRLVDSLKDLEKKYDIPEDIITNEILKTLYDVLTYKQPYDEQISAMATASYNLQIEPEDYRNQLIIYFERLEMIDDLRYRDGIEDQLESEDPSVIRDYGMAVGEICTLAERLVRFPRSITLPGIVAANIEQLYDLEETPEPN